MTHRLLAVLNKGRIRETTYKSDGGFLHIFSNKSLLNFFVIDCKERTSGKLS